MYHYTCIFKLLDCCCSVRFEKPLINVKKKPPASQDSKLGPKQLAQILQPRTGLFMPKPFSSDTFLQNESMPHTVLI